MNLDKRIIKGKKPLTRLDVEEAVKFIGKECYFCDSLDSFEYLDEFKDKLIDAGGYYVDRYKGKLLGIFANDARYVVDEYNLYSRFDYCLPCEWVKTEKKYRPYSLNEFLDNHEVGDKITFRLKLEEQPEDFIRHKVMFCGYQIVTGKADTPGEGFINLGGTLVSLQTLFEDYETPNNYLYPEVWEPFGVSDE